jgi:hypothetical protein
MSTDAEVESKITRIMRLRPGSEVDIDGFTWFRIDEEEFKVHKTGEDPDHETRWCPRDRDEVRYHLESDSAS